jgi:hypothetical protein
VVSTKLSDDSLIVYRWYLHTTAAEQAAQQYSAVEENLLEASHKEQPQP